MSDKINHSGFYWPMLNYLLLCNRFQEDAKQLRKRNIKVFSDILDSMPSLTHTTTWSEAQQMLLDNPRFTDDPDLQSRIYFHFLIVLQHAH